MRRVAAIAILTVRSAVRSRVVLALLGLLALTLGGVPLVVQGDGTLSGQVQILLRYTLGLAVALLAVAAVWTGCVAVAAEVEGRQIQLLVTKPVPAWQVWLGKWLGLVVLLGGLLGLAGATTYGMLRWTTRAARLSAEEQRALREEILVARRRTRPEPANVETVAREALEAQREAGGETAGMAQEQMYRAIRERLRLRARSVPSGGRGVWVFRLPHGARARPLFLRYRLSSSGYPGQEVRGLWLVGPSGEETRFRRETKSVSGATYSLRLPPEVAGADGRVVVVYANTHADPVTVLFAHDEDLEILSYEGTFAGNYARGLAVLFFDLAFLAAIGLTAGCAFSLPVAVFTAGWLALLTRLGGYVQGMAARRTFFERHGVPYAGPTFWDHFFRLFFRAMSVVVRPLQTPPVLDRLASGELVSAGAVAAAAIAKAAVYAAVAAVLGYWILSRREMGEAE